MTEIAELVKNVDMFELAQKTNHQVALTDDERELTAELDARFKEIGESGHDRDHEISQFLKKTVNQEIYESPDEILDMVFERGTIGEFDDYSADFAPVENTLIAHEAAKGGTVPRSYLDFSGLTPQWVNLQIESDLSYVDLRKNGWKSVSTLAEYAVAALKNSMFAKSLGVLIDGIASGAENCIVESTTMPTATSMDALATYIAERQDGDALIIGLYKYILAASRLQTASEAMKDEMYKNGILSYYGGLPMKYLSSAKKVQGQLMFPDKTILGISGKVGTLDMKGEIHTYQDENNQREMIHLMWKDYTFGYAFNAKTLEKVAKITLQ